MAKQKDTPREEKQESKEATWVRQANAAKKLRDMARPGNRTQFYRLLAMQKPAKTQKRKETSK